MSVRNGLIALLLGMSCLVAVSCRTSAPVPGSDYSLHVPDDLLKQIEALPVVKELVVDPTCLAVARKETRPLSMDGKLGFTPADWEIQRECPSSSPFIVCHPIGDRCHCFDARDEEEFGSEMEIIERPAEGSCRIVMKKVELEGALYLSGIRCEGECRRTGESCQLVRFSAPSETIKPIACSCEKKRTKPIFEIKTGAGG